MASGPRRYWRLTAQRSNANYCVIEELQLRESPGGPSVATGGTASAISEYTVSTVAANAFDGTSNVWSSAILTPSGDQMGGPWWIQYDFGAGNEKDINQISVKCSTSATEAPWDFRMEYSDNGTTWQPKGKFTAIDWATNTTQVFNLEVPVVTGPRYWRLTATAVQSGNYLTLSTILLNEGLGTANRGKGAKATASSFFSSTYYPTFAFDGLSSTAWGSANTPGGPWWVQYDHGTGYGFKCVQLSLTSHSIATESPINFVLEYSHDGSTWNNSLTVTADPPWSAGETRTYITTDDGSGAPPPTPTGRRRPVIIAAG